MSKLGEFYQRYVLTNINVDKNAPDPEWRDCTRYLAGFLMKVALLKSWGRYSYEEWKWTEEIMRLAQDFWVILELQDNGNVIYDFIEQQRINDHDYYPNICVMDSMGETILMGDHIETDILECFGITNDLFIGRRDTENIYEEYYTDQKYDPSLNWPLPCSDPPYGRRPYLQGQNPPRSQSVIWVPLPILRFAFFAKEVALFGRPFEGMRDVAKEQLSSLDFQLIHPEFRIILQKVLEMEDCEESRKALDILSNNLFLGEKPLTQAWVEGPEELLWIR